MNKQGLLQFKKKKIQETGSQLLLKKVLTKVTSFLRYIPKSIFGETEYFISSSYFCFLLEI